MKCCVNCFNDKDIKSRIESINEKGNCNICGSNDVFVYDIDINKRLTEDFDDLLNIFKPIRFLPSNYPKEKKSMLNEELLSNWNIFNDKYVGKDMVYKLLTNICSMKYKDIPELFDNPVGISEYLQEEYLLKNSLLKTYSWDDFVIAIKNDNRFHTNHINKQVFKIFCSYIKKLYKKGTVFYRARISSRDGYKLSEMGAPPNKLATAGRANPEGISYLYLSDNIETTFNEIRAGAFDYVTVGEFVLKKNISVVDLTAINKIRTFSDLDFTQHAINKPHLNRINDELAKPLRRDDSPFDYLPTQYITDFIKSIKTKGINDYDGIEYCSTMSSDGYNLAIFDESLFECENVEVYDVEKLRYEYKKVN